MELDHVFFRPDNAEPVVAQLEALGLIPTYRRTHVGQGTANVCYAFENAFLEILWVTDRDMTMSEPVERMRLATRINPFGVAWRPTVHPGPTIETWPCRPPYLPADRAIDVATASDAMELPLFFTFPGSQAPSTWSAERRGTLQSAAGYTRLELDALWVPDRISGSEPLQAIISALGGRVAVAPGGDYALDLTLTRVAAKRPHTLRLPLCTVVP